MNKLVFCASVCISFFLAACGDDSSSVEPSLDESSSSITESSSSTDAQKTSSSSSVESSSNKKVSSSSFMPGMVDSSTVVIDSITDSRDGQTYKTTTIGSQTWMALNLNYETADSYCYKDSTKYCEKYGRLYTWAAAMVACPSGWRLPTSAEFEALLSVSGGLLTAGKILKSTSGWPINGWNGYVINTDAYSFSALPAGTRFNDGSYGFEGNVVDFWSSTESDSHNAYYISFGYENDCAGLNSSNKYNGFSVRCVKE